MTEPTPDDPCDKLAALIQDTRRTLDICALPGDLRYLDNPSYPGLFLTVLKRSRNTRIRLLLVDTDIAGLRYHVLLPLARRLTSAFWVQSVRAYPERPKKSFLIRDAQQAYFMKHVESGDAIDMVKIQRWKNELCRFNRIWETSQPIPELRQF